MEGIGNNNPTRNIAQGNITRVVAVSLASVDYEDDNGFFMRAGGAGNIKYCPIGNTDAEAITKAVVASAIFEDPEVVRKIFKADTTATLIFAGYGV